MWKASQILKTRAIARWPGSSSGNPKPNWARGQIPNARI